MAEGEEFVNSHDNIDVYVTGSNSRFLSHDIRTIFRGRGDEIRVFPLSFREFCQEIGDVREAWMMYSTFGGMPRLLHYNDNEQKINYLQNLWEKTYLDDVVERNNIRNGLAISRLATSPLCLPHRPQLTKVGAFGTPTTFKTSYNGNNSVLAEGQVSIIGE